MNKVTPSLWFEHNSAISVAKQYKDIFGEDSVHIPNEETYAEPAAGGVQIVPITIFDIELSIFSAGVHDSFNDAISFVIHCKDQAEIDHIWDAIISSGGVESQCGWCHDKFGVRWQVIPENMGSLLSSRAAGEAMMRMQKIIIADLEAANA